MAVNRQWLLKTRPHGMVGPDNFDYVETPVPEPGPGQVLVRNRYLSFDPTQRGWMEDRESYLPPVAIGEPMRAGSVGRVLTSNHPDFSEGDWVQGSGGWQDYFVSDGGGPIPLRRVPPGVEPTRVLSVLGVTGLTAYWGLLDLGRPEPGQTVLVSGAAGATGSVAGQIARLQGCRVVGIAGGAGKCGWLTDEARFDAAIDYHNDDVAAAIAETCPDGVDIFFDNVGGAILEAALDQLALHARVVLCGGISAYNATEPPPGPRNLLNLVVRRARMEGFIVLDYMDRAGEAVARLSEWIDAGELVYQEDIQHGFDAIPETLTRLFTGRNEGKQLLEIDLPEADD
jgi:NADPH-dependent curcumin reductase CurA